MVGPDTRTKSIRGKVGVEIYAVKERLCTDHKQINISMRKATK